MIVWDFNILINVTKTVYFCFQENEGEDDYAKDNYGNLPLIRSEVHKDVTHTNINSLKTISGGSDALIRARLHTSRAKGKFFSKTLKIINF